MPEKISVIIPVYNVEKYLGECVNSVLCQTYKNIEILLIDDGSTDHSGEICDSFTSDKIKVYHKPNGGLSSARNYGITHATGEYLSFIDSDDCVEPHFLELLYDAINSVGDCCMISMCRFTRNQRELGVDSYTTIPMKKKDVLYRILYQEDDLLYSIAACNKLYRKEVFKHIKYPLNKLNEDMFVICDVLSTTSIVAISDFKGYYYRTNNDSITKTSFSHKNMDVVEACDYIISYVSKKKGLTELKRAAINLKFRRCFQMLYKLWASKSHHTDDEIVLYKSLQRLAPVIRRDKNAKKSTKIVAYLICLRKNIFKLLTMVKYNNT